MFPNVDKNAESPIGGHVIVQGAVCSMIKGDGGDPQLWTVFLVRGGYMVVVNNSKEKSLGPSSAEIYLFQEGLSVVRWLEERFPELIRACDYRAWELPENGDSVEFKLSE
jgi:hypothetical protein